MTHGTTVFRTSASYGKPGISKVCSPRAAHEAQHEAQHHSPRPCRVVIKAALHNTLHGLHTQPLHYKPAVVKFGACWQGPRPRLPPGGPRTPSYSTARELALNRLCCASV